MTKGIGQRRQFIPAPVQGGGGGTPPLIGPWVAGEVADQPRAGVAAGLGKLGLVTADLVAAAIGQGQHVVNVGTGVGAQFGLALVPSIPTAVGVAPGLGQFLANLADAVGVAPGLAVITKMGDAVGCAVNNGQWTWRGWGQTAVDNDSSKTTPANAQGAPDSVFATVSTALSLGDTTNPVTLTLSSFYSPSTGMTITSRKVYLYYSIAAIVGAVTDTVRLTDNQGNTFAASPALTTVGWAATDHLLAGAGPQIVDLTGLTPAQVAAYTISASYTAGVVAAPQTAIKLDAVGIVTVGSVP